MSSFIDEKPADKSLFNTATPDWAAHEIQFEQGQQKARAGAAHQRASWVIAGVVVGTELSAPGGPGVAGLTSTQGLFGVALAICAVAAWRWGRRQKLHGLGEMVHAIASVSAMAEREHRNDAFEQKNSSVQTAQNEARRESASAFSKLAAHHYASTQLHGSVEFFLDSKSWTVHIDSGEKDNAEESPKLNNTDIAVAQRAIERKKRGLRR